MKVDITSSVIEKGLDSAKGFLDKLLSPAIEETGLLIKDQISRFRFNNQVKMLARAKEKCEKYQINPQKISFKILCPLLEGASFEEQEEMIEVWASLLSNLADAEQNIENHIFPYLLSQISLQEWEALAGTYQKYVEYKETFNSNEIYERIKELEYDHTESIKELKQRKDKGEVSDKEVWHKSSEFRKIINDQKNLLQKVDHAQRDEPELEYQLISENYQYSNLYRLGIIGKKPNYVTYVKQPDGGLNGEIETKKSFYNDDEYEYHNLKVNIEDILVEIDEDGETNHLTELGILFIRSCLEKDQQ